MTLEFKELIEITTQLSKNTFDFNGNLISSKMGKNSLHPVSNSPLVATPSLEIHYNSIQHLNQKSIMNYSASCSFVSPLVDRILIGTATGHVLQYSMQNGDLLGIFNPHYSEISQISEDVITFSNVGADCVALIQVLVYFDWLSTSCIGVSYSESGLCKGNCWKKD